MSAPPGSPAQEVPAETVKEEEDVVTTENDAIETAPVSTAPPALTAPPASTEKQGLAKKDYETMTKIVKYLTEYKNEEYVLGGIIVVGFCANLRLVMKR
jgi:hypothetical protein